MEISIKGGDNGDVAKVDTNKRLHVAAVVERELVHSCDSGIEQKYEIATGPITLTDANLTSILYISNTGDSDIVLTRVDLHLGNSNSAAAVNCSLAIVRNPLAGDIITNANNCLVGADKNANQNCASSNALNGSTFKGATSEGVTSGGFTMQSAVWGINNEEKHVNLDALVIPKGSSIAAEYTPPAGNTGQVVDISVECYVRTTVVQAL
jgi:hypothetical protein